MPKTSTEESLLEILRAYPGGVPTLADHMNVSAPLLYKFASGQHAKRPVQIIEDVAAAFAAISRKVDGRVVSATRLRELWAEARGVQDD